MSTAHTYVKFFSNTEALFVVITVLLATLNRPQWATLTAAIVIWADLQMMFWITQRDAGKP